MHAHIDPYIQHHTQTDETKTKQKCYNNFLFQDLLFLKGIK